MFDLANYFASVNNSRKVRRLKSSLSSDEETASTTSVSSDSTPGSSDDSSRSYNKKKAKVVQQRKRKVDRNLSSPPLSNDGSSNDKDQGQDDEEEEAAIHYPPKIAFQIFELLELKRRCKGLYRRHQEYRRSQVIMANHMTINDFESYEIDGELFVWAKMVSGGVDGLVWMREQEIIKQEAA